MEKKEVEFKDLERDEKEKTKNKFRELNDQTLTSKKDGNEPMSTHGSKQT